jgi:purine nucleosidase
MADDPLPVLVDTDTAGDDTMALLLAARSDRIDLRAVTVVAGNVPFDYEVENAKYTLDLVDAADVPVYEGARRPLSKEFDHATDVHGEGGLGGDLFPDTGIESADEYAVDAIVDRARANPGELSVIAIGPLTNLAEATRREPDLNDLLDHVWIMGGNANYRGNVTPAAEYNFWVDPDAAKLVLAELDATLVDWGVTVRDSEFDAADLDRIAGIDAPLADFYDTVTTRVREAMRERTGRPFTTQPDSLTAAVAAYPSLIDAAGTYHVDVDEREGLTRGYSLVDETGVSGEPARTRVVESVDEDRFRDLFFAMLREENPDAGA